MEPGAADEILATLIENGSKALQGALQRGSDQTSEVVALQVLLHELGFGRPLESVELVADGDYGDATVSALRAFARANASQAKGERVTLSLGRKILARHGLLEHLRRLKSDIERLSTTAKPSKAVTGYKKPNNGGDSERVKSLQLLLNDDGARLEITGDYDNPTRDAVKPLAQTGNGRPLNLGAAQALVEKLSPKYGKHWRSPGVIRKGTVIESTTGTISPIGSEIRDHTEAPKPVRNTSLERDFSVNTGVTARLLDVRPVGQKLENWCWAASTQMMIGYLRSLGETECQSCGRSGHSDEEISQAAQMNRRLQDSEVNCGVERTAGYDYKTCDRGGWPHFFEFQDQIRSTEWASKRHVLEERGLVLRDGGQRLRVQHRLSDWQVKALAYSSGREFKKRLDDAEGAALSWEMLTHLLDHQRPVAFAFRYPHPSAGHMRLAVGYVVTPGNKRWVAVADPLPPETGEVHLIPYEFYRDGPFDGHWRDYWVAPAVKEGSSSSHREGGEAWRVGRELIASYITYPEDPAPVKPKTDGEKLSADDRVAAHREAEEGRRAVEAIVSAAKPMAVDLGMGAAWARVMAAMMADGAGSDEERALIRSEFQADLQIRDLKPGNRLGLNERDLVPVYELTAKELRSWEATGSSAENVLRLLDRPREIIFSLTRSDQAPLSFFAAVTVRRKKDRWRLSSLGRDSLMRFFVGKQFDRALDSDFLGEVAGVSAFAMLHLHLWQHASATSERFRQFLEDSGSEPTEATEANREHFRNEIEAERQKMLAQAREEIEERAAVRAEQLKELGKQLEENAAGYPGTMWEHRDELQRSWKQPDASAPDGKHQKVLEAWAEVWTQFWRAVRNPRERESLEQKLDNLPQQELEPLLRKVYYPRGLLYADGGYWRTKESLLHLLQREAQLGQLCTQWAETSSAEERQEILEGIFETGRDQQIEWLQRWSHLSKDARIQLESLKEERGLDGGYSTPKYILSVPELYQLLVAYPPSHVTTNADPHLEDEVFPVYEKSFHRPERRVPQGTLVEVLRDLQQVANDREVLRSAE